MIPSVSSQIMPLGVFREMAIEGNFKVFMGMHN